MALLDLFVDNNIYLGIFWYKREIVLILAHCSRLFQSASHHQLKTPRRQGQDGRSVWQVGPWCTGLTLRLALCHQHQGIWHFTAPLTLQVTVDSKLSPNLELEVVAQAQVERDGLADPYCPSICKLLTHGSINGDVPLNWTMFKTGNHVRVQSHFMQRDVAGFFQSRNCPFDLQKKDIILLRDHYVWSSHTSHALDAT